jgi:regulator of protease activity HflC (stomatin/prohibitin superfamily)
MKSLYIAIFAVLFLSSCAVQKPDQFIKEADVARLIKTLSSDEMEGRGTFTPGIDKAAKFIENEFKQIGLKPLEGDTDFRQDFTVKRIKPETIEATVKVYPNPSNGNFTIQLPAVFENSKVSVLNITGQEVYSTDIINNTALNLNVAAGNYFLKIQHEKYTINKRIVVE